MDDVSGLADESTNFASFLTVAWKHRYSCVYIFRTIFPEKTIWRSILSQTNIYNIFRATIPILSIRKTLETACSRKTIKYILQNALWLNRIFIELANRDGRLCIIIDCSGINKDGPGRFWTEANNPEFQTLYFISAKNKQVYNEFVSKRINRTEDSENFHFRIIKLKSKPNKNVTSCNKNVQQTNLVIPTKMTQQQIDLIKKWARPVFDIGNGTDNSVYGAEQKQMNYPSFPLNKVTEDLEKELDLDFSHDDNAVCEKNLIPKKDIKNASEICKITRFL